MGGSRSNTTRVSPLPPPEKISTNKFRQKKIDKKKLTKIAGGAGGTHLAVIQEDCLVDTYI